LEYDILERFGTRAVIDMAEVKTICSIVGKLGQPSQLSIIEIKLLWMPDKSQYLRTPFVITAQRSPSYF